MSESWSREDSSSVTNFYEKMLSAVWLIRSMAGNGTGFCVNSEGLIMTCDHVLEGDNNIILCYNCKSKVEFAARIVKRKPSWDMALLKLEGGSDQMFNHVEMGVDQIDQVFCGQDVLAIGNPSSQTSSLMMAKVTYPLKDYDISKLLNYDPAKTKYECPSSFQSHRTVGNMWPESDCDPYLPLIQTTRLNASGGSSGSPLFNKRGSVLGMVSGLGPCQINMSIHFQAINHFINLKIDDGKAGGSRLDKKGKGKRGRF